MRRNELTIALVVAVIGVLVAFWLVVLGPKRQEASGLKDDVDQLHSELSQAQEAAAAGQQARESFAGDYRKLVVMGKAVPQDGDQASLLVQLQTPRGPLRGPVRGDRPLRLLELQRTDGHHGARARPSVGLERRHAGLRFELDLHRGIHLDELELG